MCTHSRFIYNPYSRRKVLVNCGKCPACLQAKAQARTTRIRNNVSNGTITLFCTLTYSNDYVPYIRKSDLQAESFDINVYRDASCRWTYSRSNGYSFKKEPGTGIIDSVYIPHELRTDSEIVGLRHLNGADHDKVGVCINSDFQKFIKRLKQILSRNYGYKNHFSYFYCSEYGSHSKRPHFHTLVFCPTAYEAQFRDAITKAWPFADSHRTQKYVEIARDAASYVSSYVNCNNGLSSALQVPKFQSSHNYSQGFGVVLDCFSLPSLLDKIDRRDLFYYRAAKFDGVSATHRVPIPVYVIDRFFPKFKGVGRLPQHALQRIILDPASISDNWHYIENPLYDFTPSETHKIYVRLTHAIDFFCAKTGLSKYDYLHYYISVWNLHSSAVLAYSHENITDILQYGDFYSNGCELVNGEVSAPTLPSDLLIECDPNQRSDIQATSAQLIALFFKYDKEKKVVNYIMSANGHDV